PSWRFSRVASPHRGQRACGVLSRPPGRSDHEGWYPFRVLLVSRFHFHQVGHALHHATHGKVVRHDHALVHFAKTQTPHGVFLRLRPIDAASNESDFELLSHVPCPVFSPYPVSSSTLLSRILAVAFVLRKPFSASTVA